MATRRRTTKKKNPVKGPSGERDIDLRFILPPDLPIHYVDNIQVTHTPSEFLISFLQSRPPLLSNEKDWDTITEIESVCMSRIVLNPMKMQQFVQALNANFKKWMESYFQQQERAIGAKNTKTGNGANSRKSV